MRRSAPRVKKFWYAISFAQKKDGLMGSDYIVQVAEIGIENFYDFVNILNMLKTSDSKKVVVPRDGKHVSLAITPAARE
jgi:S1-C subfamily serine protease